VACLLGSGAACEASSGGGIVKGIGGHGGQAIRLDKGLRQDNGDEGLSAPLSTIIQ
jgi:hypothetical protein